MDNKKGVWALIDEIASKGDVTEIALNGPSKIFIERNGALAQINNKVSFQDIQQFINNVRELNPKCVGPIIDGSLPDGSRVNVIEAPYVHGFPAITIRRFVQKAERLSEMNWAFGLDAFWIEFFEALVSARLNIVLSGGTSVGKTTLLNSLLCETSPAERIIIIEETLELSLKRASVVRLEAVNVSGGLQIRDLVKNTLRMRPDRIILGEVRGPETFDLLQAMNTGHEGSMTSVHANGAMECLKRLENLYLMAGFEVPDRAIRFELSQAIDFIIQLKRDREGRQRVSQILEVTGFESGVILTSDIALLDENEVLTPTGIVPKSMEKLHSQGGLPKNFF